RMRVEEELRLLGGRRSTRHRIEEARAEVPHFVHGDHRLRLPRLFIPPLDGEGVALEERDGWGEYPGVENNPPPDRLPPVDLPTRGRYESEPVVKLSTPRLECRGPASAFTHHQLGPRLTQGATYCVKHTQAPPASTEMSSPSLPEPARMAKSPKVSEEAKGFLDEANGASDPAWSAWLAFLVLLTYVAVTLASVSHKNLLLNSPVRLPIINADIPLVGFFQYAPALLLLVYLSLLVQHVILARKYRKFTDAIAPYEMETGTEHPTRDRVHSYVFSQILAGPKPNRITKFMMMLIVYVTFSILPIATLLYFQIKFLPYHEVSITYWHRIAVILGFAMLILLTPIMQHAPPKRRWDVKL